jgi:transcriptional regulator of acetoin/glycerol metabolism
MATDARDIRAQLRGKTIHEQLELLGRERQDLVARETDLAPIIEDVLARAQGEVSVTEAAQLLGLHRTTLYRVYRRPAA